MGVYKAAATHQHAVYSFLGVFYVPIAKQSTSAVASCTQSCGVE